ncbi:eEF1A lysine and N-terminal methyltransferase-like isoform X1 [Zingiber officinale]|uniref:eEF1A lysine and N-terminal methyltransferase-like isoform X1 n=1 Tax=Zingiber officinale TaxID=94328 RepID=UPI001C4B7822|nr:eEF1A lysine and N-terminal methyltransferase-like isoform X1 [Zingiber officinale]
MEAGEFERLSPSRFISFAFPNPQPGDPYADPLRVAVLDSPLPGPAPPPRTAAMLVPPGREDDWLFCTAAGQIQLLISSSGDPSICRLILIGGQPSSTLPKCYSRNEWDPDSDRHHRFQQLLTPLLLALSPKSSFSDGLPDIPFLSFEDDVIHITPVEMLVGPSVGEMLVEDVVLDRSQSPKLRRRLRFKRMPNLVQSQVHLLPDSSSSSRFGSFMPEKGSLVQPYLRPMVASLSLISPAVDLQVQSGLMPRVLCVGVGGGALLMSLRLKFGFDVLGIEADELVLDVAKRHFGLTEDDFLKVGLGDGLACIKYLSILQTGKIEDVKNGEISLELVKLLRRYSSGFDVVMVDLDSEDASNCVFAPPLEFVEKGVLMALRTIIKEHGVVTVNVVPSCMSFYKQMIDDFGSFFSEVYEIDVGNGENYVLVATASPVDILERNSEDPFFKELKEVVGQKKWSSERVYRCFLRMFPTISRAWLTRVAVWLLQRLICK